MRRFESSSRLQKQEYCLDDTPFFVVFPWFFFLLSLYLPRCLSYNKVIMKNITTYYSSRKNVFVWLAVLLSLVSAVTRIMACSGADSAGFGVVVVHILFPIAANLFISVRLPWRCGEMFYVTVNPVVLLAIHFFFRIVELEVPAAITICCIIFCVLQLFAFMRTYKGYWNSKLPVLTAWLMPLLFCLDEQFRGLFVSAWQNPDCMPAVLTELSAWLSVVCIILASRKMPAPEEGEPYRRRYGDRYEGRRLYGVYPMGQMVPYFMPNRVGSSNYILDKIEITNVEKYIHAKRKSGCKHFGLTHLFLAAYVRAVAEYPALNRFIAGQKIYHRFDIVCSMVIKKEMSSSSPDTTIKVKFNPADTAEQVYEKFNAAVQEVKATEELDNNFDAICNLFSKIPSILMAGAIWIFRILDYFGLLPIEIQNLSPFHASMFITSMGSLGIPPIFHHLYDFGTMPQFCAFGAKYTERTTAADGTVSSKKYVDFTWVTDERICDGFYYAAVLKRMKTYLLHPEVLDTPPEEVKEDIA